MIAPVEIAPVEIATGTGSAVDRGREMPDRSR